MPQREEGNGGCIHLTAGKARLKDGQSVAQGQVGDSGWIMYQSFLSPKLLLSSPHPSTAQGAGSGEGFFPGPSRLEGIHKMGRIGRDTGQIGVEPRQ